MTPTEETTDQAAVLRRAQSGDAAAFGILFREHHAATLRLIRAIVRDAHAADEVSQDAWLTVWNKLPGFRGDAAFTTWLHAIAVRKAIDHLRRRRGFLARFLPFLARDAEAGAEGVAEEAVPSGDPAPDAALESAERRARFERALAAVPPKHRAVLVLREVEGLSYEEIAATLHLRPGTVMSRLFHARRILASKWKSQPCD